MPLPLGHLAIGITTYDLTNKNVSVFRNWRLAIVVVVLANLPDIDVLFGLLWNGNGNVFHRGPTHSILFAVLLGAISANLWKVYPFLPRLTFFRSFLLIFSHLIADLFLTSSPISLFWPFEIYVSPGYCGWGEVLHSVFAQWALQDVGIIMICGMIVLCRRLVSSDTVLLLPRAAFNRSGKNFKGENKE
jgi:hypothetical protein